MPELLSSARLQLHKDFDLRAAAAQVPYYADLGISHFYLSPIGTAVQGSAHGYDVVDPTRINPELGGEDAFRELVRVLRAYRMGAIVDIVPNHVATDLANPWWRDVLAYGRRSTFAGYFDIDWLAPAAKGKLWLPILDAPLATAIEVGKVRLAIDADSDQPALACAGQYLPLSTISLLSLLASAGLAPVVGKTRIALVSVWARAMDEPGSRAGLVGLIEWINAAPGRLHALVDQQHYRLADWRSGNDVINYRRFFDIGSLIALAVEREEVFRAVHALPLRLIAEGLVDGLRIDHVDGLSYPGRYLKRLRRAVDAVSGQRPEGVPRHVTLHVEKILASTEVLRADWPVQGTTGYEFMDQACAVLHDPAGAPALRRAWHDIGGRPTDFGDEEGLAREEMLDGSLQAEFAACIRAWAALAHSHGATADITPHALGQVLGGVLGHMPVYRSYLDGSLPQEADREVLMQALVAAGTSSGRGDVAAQLRIWLLETTLRQLKPGLDRHRMRLAWRRFEQTTAPLNAKSVEDTGFYRYGVLLSRNEVGSDPRHIALAPAAFHAAMQRRARDWPRSLSATATHDHKRGEDARARLALLSERPDAFVAKASRWIARWREREKAAPDAPEVWPGDMWMLVQTILAAWPLELRSDDARGMASFAARLVQWQRKALREAKLRTSWTAPDEAYETACVALVTECLTDDSAHALRSELGDAARELDAAGALNSLAMTVLRLVAPGIPDLYQGTEYWDQSLVDPDNRRPVDYALRRASLDEPSDVQTLLRTYRNGRIKQWTIARMLRLRHAHPDTFLRGDYRPLHIGGEAARHALAFVRTHGAHRCIVVVPRLCAGWVDPCGAPHVPANRWKDTFVRLIGDDAACTYRDVFMGNELVVLHDRLLLADLLGPWSVAVLESTLISPDDRHDQRS
jgi:(1->4)-alpha-D-glucan 1-alpha-D-glucosylmutase